MYFVEVELVCRYVYFFVVVIVFFGVWYFI